MKNLKSLIQRLVKEAITDKLGEGQPVGGVKNDHEFDAGRHGVMKAVNIGEGSEGRPCDCGSGEMSYWEKDGQGIPLCRACPKCRKQKLSKYRPEILRPYDQSDVDEPIEPEDFEESIGFDGKYVDDMDSGTQVKRIEGLKEMTPFVSGMVGGVVGTIGYRLFKDVVGILMKKGLYAIPLNKTTVNFLIKLVNKLHGNQYSNEVDEIRDEIMELVGKGKLKTIGDLNKWLSSNQSSHDDDSIEESQEQDPKKIARQIRRKELVPYYPENFKQVPNYIRLKKKPETGEFVVYWYVNGKLDENKSYFTDDLVDAWNTFVFMKRSVDEENAKTGGSAVKESAVSSNEDKIAQEAQKIAVSAFGKNVESVRPMNPIEPNVYPFVVTLVSKKKLLPGEKPGVNYGKGEKTYIRYSSVNNRWEKFDGIAKKYVPVLKEETGTGAVAGYQTPFAFSKKKQGSSRAIAAAKKYGKVVKSISETEETE